ncbi:MAG: hypothetical protein U1F27_04060 [Turneriella sp.]
MFLDFFYALRAEGLAVGADQILDFYSAPERIDLNSTDDLFLLLRLICVKRRDDLDVFERTFLNYFYAMNIPAVAEGDIALLETKQFKDWLRQARQSGDIPLRSYDLDIDALMKKFWDTVPEQMKETPRWQPLGRHRRNIPVWPFRQSRGRYSRARTAGHFSALKVIGERRHIAYSSRQTLSGDNVRQAIALMKNMKKHASLTELDIQKACIDQAKAATSSSCSRPRCATS